MALRCAVGISQTVFDRDTDDAGCVHALPSEFICGIMLINGLTYPIITLLFWTLILCARVKL